MRFQHNTHIAECGEKQHSHSPGPCGRHAGLRAPQHPTEPGTSSAHSPWEKVEARLLPRVPVVLPSQGAAGCVAESDTRQAAVAN